MGSAGRSSEGGGDRTRRARPTRLKAYTGPMLVSINGKISSPEEARISVFDRGFMYGDSVYEVIRFFGGIGVGFDQHVRRLRRSLEYTGIPGFDPDACRSICHSLMDALRTKDAMIYLQITRGVQIPRQHCPAADLEPTVVAIGSPSGSLESISQLMGVAVTVEPDLRRVHCDIKATTLLENVLATMAADRQGAEEPILQIDGLLTEGSSSNIFVVEGQAVCTPQLEHPRPILPGISRELALEAARGLGFEVREAPVTVEQLRNAQEAFITSSSRVLASITAVDGKPIRSGTGGAVTLQIHEELVRRLRADSSLTSNT